jgi:hypothetical protein
MGRGREVKGQEQVEAWVEAAVVRAEGVADKGEEGVLRQDQGVIAFALSAVKEQAIN